MLVKPGGNVLSSASDPSKHENHPERSAAFAELKESGLKIHETVKPRSWWLSQLSKYELLEDKEAMSTFLKINQKIVHDPRYGYSVANKEEDILKFMNQIKDMLTVFIASKRHRFIY